jgi:hypothetical protein
MCVCVRGGGLGTSGSVGERPGQRCYRVACCRKSVGGCSAARRGDLPRLQSRLGAGLWRSCGVLQRPLASMHACHVSLTGVNLTRPNLTRPSSPLPLSPPPLSPHTHPPPPPLRAGLLLGLPLGSERAGGRPRRLPGAGRQQRPLLRHRLWHRGRWVPRCPPLAAASCPLQDALCVGGAAPWQLAQGATGWFTPHPPLAAAGAAGACLNGRPAPWPCCPACGFNAAMPPSWSTSSLVVP